MEQMQITQQQLENDLINIGLQHGGLVYVYTSLKKNGRLEDGHQSLINAFFICTGNEGTLAVPRDTLLLQSATSLPTSPRTLQQ